MNDLTAHNLRSEKLDRIILAFLIIFLASSAFSIAVEQIGFFTALALWLGKMVYFRKNLFRKTSVDILFLLFFASELVSAIVSYNKPQAFLYLQRRVVVIPIIYAILGNVNSRKELKILVAAFIVSALGVSLWQVKDLFLHLGEYLHFQKRIGEFQIYMTAGGVMMIAGLALIPFVLHKSTPSKIRWTAALALIPILINLFFTFTRSSWLGFLGGLCLIGLLKTKKIFIGLAVLVVAILLFSSPEVKGRISSIVDPNHPSNVTRVNMWHVGWELFLDHPLVGVGDIGVEIFWYRYSDLSWHPEGHFHNNLIMWLATLGIVGFGILVTLFIKLWLAVARIEKKFRDDWLLGSITLGTLAVYLGFHINGLFEWNFGDAEIIMMVWALTGLSFAAQWVGERESV